MDLPSTETTRLLSTSADNREAATALLRDARRDVAWFTRDLEPLVFDDDMFIDALRALATRSRFSRVRIVAIDPGPAIRRGHRLIGLAQRFSSAIEVRRAAHDHADMAETFMVIDEQGVLYRPISNRYEGYADPHAPIEARLHLKTFVGIWEAAQVDPEFRRLGI